jgi:hydroxymethylbilane synthase
MHPALEDPPTRQVVTAERAFLSGLGGGCAAPIAALARLSAARLSLTGLVATPDGGQLVRVSGEGYQPEALGRALARQALEQGAAELIANRVPGA